MPEPCCPFTAEPAHVCGPFSTEFVFQFSDPRFQVIHFTWHSLQPLPDRNAVERLQDVFDEPHAGDNTPSGSPDQTAKTNLGPSGEGRDRTQPL